MGLFDREYKHFTLYKEASLPKVSNDPTDLDFYIDSLLESLDDGSDFKSIHLDAFALLLCTSAAFIFFFSRIKSGSQTGEPDKPHDLPYLKTAMLTIAVVFLILPVIFLRNHSRREGRLLEQKTSESSDSPSAPGGDATNPINPSHTDSLP